MKMLKSTVFCCIALVASMFMSASASAAVFSDTYTTSGSSSFDFGADYYPAMNNYNYMVITTRISVYDSSNNLVTYFEHEAELGPWVGHSHWQYDTGGVTWGDNLNYDQGWMWGSIALDPNESYTIVVEQDDHGLESAYYWGSGWTYHDTWHANYGTRGSYSFSCNGN